MKVKTLNEKCLYCSSNWVDPEWKVNKMSMPFLEGIVYRVISFLSYASPEKYKAYCNQIWLSVKVRRRSGDWIQNLKQSIKGCRDAMLVLPD